MNKSTKRVQLLAVALAGACGLASAAVPVYRYADCAGCTARLPDSTGSTGVGDGVLTTTMTVPPEFCSGTTVTAYGLQLTATHTNIGDLKVTLTSPGLATVTILNRPISGGNCAGDDIQATFVDTGVVQSCGTKIPALSGDVKSSGTLSVYSGLLTGSWTAEVRDQAPGGDGYVDDLQLRVQCGYTDDIFNNSLEIP